MASKEESWTIKNQKLIYWHINRTNAKFSASEREDFKQQMLLDIFEIEDHIRHKGGDEQEFKRWLNHFGYKHICGCVKDIFLEKSKLVYNSADGKELEYFGFLFIQEHPSSNPLREFEAVELSEYLLHHFAKQQKNTHNLTAKEKIRLLLGDDSVYINDNRDVIKSLRWRYRQQAKDLIRKYRSM